MGLCFGLPIKRVHGVTKHPSLLLDLSAQSLNTETLKELCLGLVFLGFQKQIVQGCPQNQNVYLAWHPAFISFQICLMTKVNSKSVITSKYG